MIARVGFTLWFAIWVPIVLHAHGPQNFWWSCNLAQFLVLYAVWRPNPLLISSQSGMVALIGVVWTLDFITALLVGGSLTGITGYMFNPDIPLIARLASLYHIWLPAFLIWLCWYHGYDNRGVWLQCLIGTLTIVGAWLFTDPVRNINYAFAPFDIPQVWLPAGVYVALLSLITALTVYVPGHFLMRVVLRRLPPRGAATAA